MKIQRIILFALALSFFTLGHSYAQKTKKDKKKEKKDKKEKKTNQLFSNVSKLKASVSDREEEFAMDAFTEGMKHFILEDYEKAIERFEKSIEYSPKNPAVMYQIGYTYTKIGKFDKALPYAKKALELDNQNEYYYNLLGDIHKYNGEFEQAVNVYKQKIALLSPALEEYYLDLAAAYLSQGAYKEAINVYDECETKFGFGEAIVRQKQKIYLRINDVKNALAEGEKLLEHFPNSTELILDQVQLLMTTNNTDKAVKLLENILKEDPEDARAKFLLSDVYRIQGDSKKSIQMLEESFVSPNLRVELKIDVLAGYLQRMHNASEREIGLKLAELTIKTHPNHPKANSMYADFLIALDTPESKEKARVHYLNAIKADGNDFNAWRQIVGIDFDLQQMDSIVEHTEQALEYFPNQAILYLQHGTGQLALTRYEEAKDALEQGKMLARGNDKMLLQFNSQLGDAYHNLNEYAAADAAFEAVLAADPNDEHALNNYSFFLSIRKEKLQKAKEMSTKLVELAPDNGNYLDTHGSVLYSLEEYEAARKVFEKAVVYTVSGAVFERYGDVLYHLGEKEAAILQWKRAKVLGGVNDPEMLEKKLAEGKLIE